MDPVPELFYLTNEELKDLLQCEDKLHDFIERLPEMSSAINRCHQMAEENYKLANENLAMKVDYEKVRAETINKVEELSTLHANFEKLSKDHQELSEQLAPSSLQETMMFAAAQSEEESENIAEEFLDTKIGINQFLCQYLEKRVESHLRKFKGERLFSQLKELQKAGF